MSAEPRVKSEKIVMERIKTKHILLVIIAILVLIIGWLLHERWRDHKEGSAGTKIQNYPSIALSDSTQVDNGHISVNTTNSIESTSQVAENSELLQLLNLDPHMSEQELNELFGAVRTKLKLKAPKPLQELDPYKVLRVIDGDTLKVKSIKHPGKPIRLRLLGINVPESFANPNHARQTLSGEAVSIVVKRFLQGKTIYLEYDEGRYDQYDRLLAYVWLDDEFMLNEALLQLGWCHAVKFEPNKRYYDYFKELEKEHLIVE